MNIENININYLSKDYNTINNDLINYAKAYFPNSYQDFSNGSPVSFFMGMVGYVGEILSFYIDKRFQESNILTAIDRKNVINLSSQFGYTHVLSSPSFVDVDFYQLVPNNGTDTPNFDYSIVAKQGDVSIISNGIVFTNVNDIDVSKYNVEISIYDYNNGLPSYYLVKQNVKFASLSVGQETFNISTPSDFLKLKFSKTDIVSIISCIDSLGNIWYEVPYLSCEIVCDETENTLSNNSIYSNYYSDVPYLLNFKRTNKRFIKRINNNDEVEVMFGAGVSSLRNEDIISNVDSFNNLFLDTSIADKNIDFRNFLKTDSFGEVPHNVTLTFRYFYGGGINSNIDSFSLNNINRLNHSFKNNNINVSNDSRAKYIKDNLRVENKEASIGGGGKETINEIKYNSIYNFYAQNRLVSKEDYVARCLVMDPKFGKIHKVYVEKDIYNQSSPVNESNIVNIYGLSKNKDGKLVKLNEAIKYNLKNYLEQYRLLTENIVIRDPYIINIGLNFSINIIKGFNGDSVLLNCLNKIKEFFNIDKFSICQSIFISDIESLLYETNGVRNVIYIEIVNKNYTHGDYSNIIYNVDAAIRNNILYSPKDPSIFELKYQNLDINGRIE